MTFERTTDYGLVRQILADPGIYARMGDDFAPPIAEFVVNEHPAIWYVLVYPSAGDLVSGLFCFFPENGICWAGHVAFLRKTPPAITLAAGRAVVPWLWANTPCVRLVASIPAYNRAAIRFARRAMGLAAHGRNKASFMKRGTLHDQVLLGISKPSPQR